MVDGGVCDAIPIRRAIADGFSKNVIILTRNKGYRKEEKDFYLPGFIYNKYPAIRKQLRLRYRRYNEVLDYIDQLEAEGKAFVIRPQSPIKVGRTGSDTKKLEELYDSIVETGHAPSHPLKTVFYLQPCKSLLNRIAQKLGPHIVQYSPSVTALSL